MAYGSFEELEVWQRARKVSVELFRLLKGSKEFGLRDQMTRAAVSIASNIAEGAERGSSADFIRFLHIAKGSAGELRAQLYIASDLGNILPEAKVIELIQELKRISKMLHALVVSLSSKSTSNR